MVNILFIIGLIDPLLEEKPGIRIPCISAHPCLGNMRWLQGQKVLSIIGPFLVESHIKGFIVSITDVLKGKAVVLTTKIARKEDRLKRPTFRHQSSSKLDSNFFTLPKMCESPWALYIDVAEIFLGFCGCWCSKTSKDSKVNSWSYSKLLWICLGCLKMLNAICLGRPL